MSLLFSCCSPCPYVSTTTHLNATPLCCLDSHPQYDPETAKTVVDLQAEKAAAADAAAAAAAAAPASTNADSADGDVSAPVKPKLYYARNATPLDASATVQEAGKALSHSLNAAPVSEKDVTSRLRDRIDELRSKRNLKSVRRFLLRVESVGTFFPSLHYTISPYPPVVLHIPTRIELAKAC